MSSLYRSLHEVQHMFNQTNHSLGLISTFANTTFLWCSNGKSKHLWFQTADFSHFRSIFTDRFDSVKFFFSSFFSIEHLTKLWKYRQENIFFYTKIAEM